MNMTSLPKMMLAAAAALSVSAGVALAAPSRDYAAYVPTEPSAAMIQREAPHSAAEMQALTQQATPPHMAMPFWESGFSNSTQLTNELEAQQEGILDSSSG